MTPDWWFYVSLFVCLASTLICLVAGLRKLAPNDVTILAVLAIDAFLLVYLVASIIRVASGEQITGATWEFWGYLITALVVPLAGIYWSLLERSRWSNFVLAAMGLIVVVMMFRMEQIWYGPATSAAAALVGAA